MTRLAIIIVSYNCRADLHACLSSLAASPPHVPHEIVVVDNLSSDGTPAFLRQYWPAITLLEPGANLGFAAANNVALRQTQDPLVLLLNPDTTVPPGAIDCLVEWLQAHPDVAVVGPRIVDADGRAELSFGRLISPWHELRQKLLVVGHDRRVSLVSAFVERTTRLSKAVDWVSGACLLARHEDLAAAGFFDERFFLYTEDVDLCASVRRRGRAVWFLPDAEVTHRRGRSGTTTPAATGAAYRRSHLAFYEKHHPRWAPLLKAYLKIRGR